MNVELVGKERADVLVIGSGAAGAAVAKRLTDQGAKVVCLEQDGWDGPFGIPLFSQNFYETDDARGFVRGYTFQIERSFGPLHQAWGGFTNHPIPWGMEHHRVMRQRFGHVIRQDNNH